MRRILTAALFVFTLSAPALADTAPAGATVLPQNPAGEPEAVRCDRTAATRIRDLHCTSNAERSQDTVPEGVTLRAYQPVGNGDPNAISCWAYRTTPPIRGLQCARNWYWARLNGLPPNQLDSLQQGQPPQMSGGWPWQNSSSNH